MEVSKLFAQHPRRNPLERSDQIGQGHLGRVVDQQMHMVMFAVELHQLSLKILAHACENQLHGIEVLFLEHVASILCYEYQVHMKSENTMPSMAKIAIYIAIANQNAGF